MNIIAGILWFAMFVTPFVTILLVWRVSDANKITKVIVGIVLALIISCVFYTISLLIIFRDGMGPG
jgi:hypothetical protein